MREDIAEYALERAAIMEYDGGLPKEEAERRARVEVKRKFGGRHGNDKANTSAASS